MIRLREGIQVLIFLQLSYSLSFFIGVWSRLPAEGFSRDLDGLESMVCIVVLNRARYDLMSGATFPFFNFSPGDELRRNVLGVSSGVAVQGVAVYTLSLIAPSGRFGLTMTTWP